MVSMLKKAALQIGGDPEHGGSYRTYTDQIVSEQRQSNNETTPLAHVMSKQLLVCEVAAGILVHDEEQVAN